MNWELWIPWIAVVVTLLGVWGSLQRQLGKLDARITSLERQCEEMQAEYLRLHQEAKAEYLRLHQETIRMHEEMRAEYLRLHQETIRMYEEARAENLRLYEEARAENLRLYEEARAENLRLHQEARAENLRLHEETREIIRREIRLGLQMLREHTHADGSPAVTPIPAEVDAD